MSTLMVRIGSSQQCSVHGLHFSEVSLASESRHSLRPDWCPL